MLNSIMKTKLLTLFVLLFAFSNCKKDDTSSSNILLSKTWKRALYDKNPSTNPQGTILYHFVRDCEIDDTYKFGSDGNLMVNKNSDKCDQSELQTENQVYTLNRTNKELIINGTKFTLAEESNNQIKYYTPVSSGNGFQNLIFLLQ